MIAVRVGDEDRIERSQVLDRGSRGVAAHVQDAVAEQWVGQQSQPGQLDQHRRVTNVGEPARLGHRYGVVAVVVAVLVVGVVAAWSWSW